MSTDSQSYVLTYGSPSNSLIDEALKTFTGGRISHLSSCTTPVEILSNDGKDTVVGTASGFFWHHSGRDWIVTNWHVVSGRNIFTKALAPNGLIPRKIRVYGWVIKHIAGVQISTSRQIFTYTLPDVVIEKLSVPVQVNGKEVDIFALPLPPNFAMRKELPTGQAMNGWGTVKACVNQIEQDKINSEAGDDCMVVGYPLKNHTGLLYPIWKRGSISTDTAFSIDDAPAFLVDAATSSGMSGSPVFRRIVGATEINKATQVISEHKGYQFVGVYAGRLQSAELEKINMGYVWFGSLMEPTLIQCEEVWKEIEKLLGQDPTQSGRA